MSLDVVKFVRDQAAGWGDEEDAHRVAIEKVADELAKRLETEYVGPLYQTDYVVTGRGPFPLDMLRYTQSWPRAEEDVREIDRSIELSAYDDPFTIRLTKNHRDPRPNLELDQRRWVSKFRWRVVFTEGAVETKEI